MTEAPVSSLAGRTASADRMQEALHQFDTAHALMLGEQGLIPRDKAVELLRGLHLIERRGVVGERVRVQGGLHSGERLLIEELGEDTGGWIHVGRSSADLSAVAVRLTLRHQCARLLECLAATRHALLKRSQDEAETVMLAYTHGQGAQPTTFGHWLAMWASVFGRDWARIFAVMERSDQSPAGGAATAGTEFLLDRARVASLLGFRGLVENSTDATHSHDIEMEALAAFTILSANLGRLAADLLAWSGDEFGYVTLADRYCATSSILAHKRNPVQPQMTEAAAALALGAFVAAVALNQNPTGGSILAQPTASQLPLWDLCDTLGARLGELPDLIDSLKVHRERMLAVARASWCQASDLAGLLVRDRELSWRTAHQVVAILVRLCEERGIAAAQVGSQLVNEAANIYLGRALGLDQTAIENALDPRASVERRTLVGGPAPSAVRSNIEHLAVELAADARRLSETQKRWVDGRQALATSVSEFVAGDR
ncbi:MAG: argininosuccinate lyase [Acidimicrobiales bacterium]